MSAGNKSIIRIGLGAIPARDRRLGCGGVLGTLPIRAFEPVKERAPAIWNTPEAMKWIANDVDELLAGLADARDAY